MCVIAYKPDGVKFPTKSTLKTCYNNNPDGAGFMYADGERVHICKGFMTFNSFWRALRGARKRTGDKIPYVLHFRISTQAGTRPDCTHPFPLSKNMDDLRQLNTFARFGVAHNGIIDLTAYNAKGVTHSDTMEFITDYLSLIIRTPDYHHDRDTVQLITRLCGSRLAIMDTTGHVELIGTGWTQNGGTWYSNRSYINYTQQPYLKNDPLPMYHFDPFDCPCTEYGDDCYCMDCVNFNKCYSLE